MLERSFDYKWLNTVLNDPDVLPFVKGPAISIESSPAVLDNKNILLRCTDREGAFFFAYQEDGRYELHTQFIKAARNGVLRRGLVAVDTMFNDYKAKALITHVPRPNVPARRLAEGLGFKFIKEHGTWPLFEEDVPNDFYVYTREDWEKA